LVRLTCEQLFDAFENQ